MANDRARRLSISLVTGDGISREIGEVFVRLSSTAALIVSLTEGGFAAVKDAARTDHVTFVALDGDVELRVPGWIIDYHPIGTLPDRFIYRVDVEDATTTVVEIRKGIAA